MQPTKNNIFLERSEVTEKPKTEFDTEKKIIQYTVTAVGADVQFTKVGDKVWFDGSTFEYNGVHVICEDDVIGIDHA